MMQKIHILATLMVVALLASVISSGGCAGEEALPASPPAPTPRTPTPASPAPAPAPPAPAPVSPATPSPPEEPFNPAKPHFFVLSDATDAIPEGAQVVLEHHLTPQEMEKGARMAHLAGVRYGIFVSLHDIEWLEREEFESLLQDAVAIGFDGNPIIGWAGAFYDTNHPLWQQFLVDKMKEAVDAGAEVICTDDHEGNAWFSNRGDYGEVGVFGGYSMQGFRDYLASKYSMDELADFGIDDLETFDYAAYLKEKGYAKEDIHEQILRKLFYHEFNPIDVPLFEDFQAFQNQSMVNFQKRLIAEIKEYGIRTQGR
ncbi:hypothetical protein DRH29_04650, partial [candidate division Kazan bacterium]